MRVVPPKRPPATSAELQALESYHKLLDGYMWLAQAHASPPPPRQLPPPGYRSCHRLDTPTARISRPVRRLPP